MDTCAVVVSAFMWDPPRGGQTISPAAARRLSRGSETHASGSHVIPSRLRTCAPNEHVFAVHTPRRKATAIRHGRTASAAGRPLAAVRRASATGREFALRAAAESCRSKFGLVRNLSFAGLMVELAPPARGGRPRRG